MDGSVLGFLSVRRSFWGVRDENLEIATEEGRGAASPTSPTMAISSRRQCSRSFCPWTLACRWSTEAISAHFETSFISRWLLKSVGERENGRLQPGVIFSYSWS